MSKTRKHFLIVQISIAKWYRQNHSGVTVRELFHFMNQQGDNPVTKRTVRRCLEDLVDVNFVKKREVGNSTLYVPDIALFPDPERAKFQEEQDEKIVLNFEVKE